jgi:hypothetical protein
LSLWDEQRPASEAGVAWEGISSFRRSWDMTAVAFPRHLRRCLTRHTVDNGSRNDTAAALLSRHLTLTAVGLIERA